MSRTAQFIDRNNNGIDDRDEPYADTWASRGGVPSDYVPPESVPLPPSVPIPGAPAPTPGPAVGPPVNPTTPAAPGTAAPWQHPTGAFQPNASQNAPRLFQDPTTGAWTLSEHGNFRPLQGNEVAAAQGYVTDFWRNMPTGFIQPGQTNYDPNQPLTNAGYGKPSNWQSLYTNAKLPTPSAATNWGGAPGWPTGNTTPSTTGPQAGTLAELTRPERVESLSQSSYNDPNNRRRPDIF